MARRPMDLSLSRLSLPDMGWRRGWESAALLALTLCLLGFGLVNLYSASSFMATRQGLADWFYVLNQMTGAAVGLLALAICARIPVRFWERMAWPIVWVTVFLLVLVILPFTHSIAPEVKGARRWLDLGIRFQPSDFAKVAMVVWTAMMAVKKREDFRSLTKGLGPFMLIWGVLLLPIALEPDFSTTVLIAMVGLLTVFAAGARLGHFVFFGLLIAPLVKMQLAVGFRQERLRVALNPLLDPDGVGFQGTQSLIAVGSGGLTGQGFGEGQQKFGFLPEPHNDFIFAMIAEEWGFVGVAILVALFVTTILVGYRIARRTRDPFGQLLAIGVTNLIALQAMLHMAVGLALVPTTGLALPLVSYGRTSLVITLALIGMLMAVARETDEDWKEDVRERGRAEDLARMDRIPLTPGAAHG